MQPSSLISDETSFTVESIDCGVLRYGEARALQESLVERVRQGNAAETIIFCEHEPVLTLGRLTKPDDLDRNDPFWRDHRVELVGVSRGGGPTYHGPGQLMIYPVIDLRRRRLGVKSFVDEGLRALSDVTRSYGLEAHHSLEPAGVWVDRQNDLSTVKIASVGLRIEHGVTNHGFSLIVSGDIGPFVRFRPCSLSSVLVSSIERELGNRVESNNFSMPLITAKVLAKFREFLG